MQTPLRKISKCKYNLIIHADIRSTHNIAQLPSTECPRYEINNVTLQCTVIMDCNLELYIFCSFST